jgi:hypothetical protein
VAGRWWWWYIEMGSGTEVGRNGGRRVNGRDGTGGMRWGGGYGLGRRSARLELAFRFVSSQEVWIEFRERRE